MRRRTVPLAIVAAIAGAGLFWFITTPGTVPASALPAHKPIPENGKEMFYAGGCTSCHAIPGDADKTRLGGGLGLKSPFGTFYAPNISSDPNDGIGKWSEADFVTAMRKGTSPDGRHYFPAFPYTSYQRMPLADLRDLLAYLKTLPAVQGKVRDHDVPFPFNVRRLLGGWKFLFLWSEADDGSDSASVWKRGEYLVNGPGHCAECHSPRNLLGGIVSSQRFAGGPNPEGEGWVPNITQQALKDYSLKDIDYLLETGNTPDGDSVGGAMTAVIRNTSQLSAYDRNAIAVYIKSLAPVEGPKKPEKK
jgi:mono/diheme cytochrome c family protein